MRQILHGGQRRLQAARFGINPKTVAKWRKRQSVSDLPDRPMTRRKVASCWNDLGQRPVLFLC
ncbi:MAG: hypothetical protein LBD68_01545 [Zoogloeaceae bacterium]|jgi:transposase-like protein|nr:hypothetical protein [Zoogloeaceae bacterium]